MFAVWDCARFVINHWDNLICHHFLKNRYRAAFIIYVILGFVGESVIHYNNHRYGFFVPYQIIKYKVCPSLGCPSGFILKAAMLQI